MENQEETLEEISASFFIAIQSHQPLPAIDRKLDLSEAYAVQELVVKEICPEGPAGIKAGLTSKVSQHFFQLEHALLGRLTEKGRLTSGAALTYRQGLSIECEIGILIDANGNPTSVSPAIEFVFVEFERKEDMNAVNLVASNVAVDHFLQGDKHAWQDNWQDIPITLKRDNEVINQASILESMGGPDQALSWIKEEAARRKIGFTQDMLLMTGACGKVLPALPGYYVADYAEMGQIEFTISKE